MKNKFEHQILVGQAVFKVKVSGVEKNDQIFLDADSLMVEQKKLARKLIIETEKFDANVLNFVLNVSKKRAVEIASYLECTPAHLSQTRSGKECSSQFWKLFRVVMISILDGQKNRAMDEILLNRVA